MFYATIDEVFDEIYDKYGLTDQLIAMKEKLLYVYANEEKIKGEKIYEQIRPRYFTFNKDNGEIEFKPLESMQCVQ